METTGRSFRIILALMFMGFSAHAELSARIDRAQIPIDESLTLKITSESPDGLDPKFNAPDFDIINQFESSQFSSVYNNGQWQNLSKRSVTFILRPLKAGTLSIRDITNGEETAPNLTIKVTQPESYQKTVPENGKKLSPDQENFFVRGEIPRKKVYRGEQFAVSFYLYRRTRTNLRDVIQYPSFEGFIREDLEMPILSGRPDFEAVNVGGIPFERGLLARYALYPIQTGKLKINSLSVRVDYIPKNSASNNLLQDPFFQFFNQVNPRTAISKSDPLEIEVLPLPEEGRTDLFTGGVGSFDVRAELEGREFKANSPVTLKITVSGKGNGNLIEFPKVKWPEHLRFYEAQGQSKTQGNGVTQKTFEVVLVPLQSGELSIPEVEFEFFDPENQSYIRKKTNPLIMVVQEGDPGSLPPPTPIETSDTVAPIESPTASPGRKEFSGLRLQDSAHDAPSSFLGQPSWRWVAWFGLLVFFSFVGLIVFDSTRKRSNARIEASKKKQERENTWNALIQEAKTLNDSPNQALGELLVKVTDEIYRTLDASLIIQSRALPQRELGQTLSQRRKISEGRWSQIIRILDLSERIRFAGNAAGSEQDLSVENLTLLLQNAKEFCLEISTKKDKS